MVSTEWYIAAVASLTALAGGQHANDAHVMEQVQAFRRSQASLRGTDHLNESD